MRDDRRFRFLNDPAGSLDISTNELRLMIDPNTEDGRIIDLICLSIEESGELPFIWGPQEEYFIKHAPREQLAAYLAFRYKMSVYPQQRIVSEFPVYLLVEPASPCNLRCGFCFQVDPTFNKKSSGYMGYMDLSLYERIIDEAAEGGTRAITLASRGEPLLHPDLPKMLRYTHRKGKFFDIKVNTNATLLNEKNARAILESGVNILVLSIDSADPKQYAELRVGANFEKVLTNVRRFMKIRDEYPDSCTEVRVAGVKIRADQDEELFSRFWSKEVDTVAMGDAEERWDTYNNSVKDVTHPCAYMWERAYIWFDGSMGVCDVDYKNMLNPGSIMGSSIRDVWHGEKYTKLREAHAQGTRRSYIPCDRCGV